MFSKNTPSKLSIECDERSVRVVQSGSGNVVSVERCCDFDWPDGVSLQSDPHLAGAWLKSQLAAICFDVEGTPTTAIVQRESVILKSIGLPQVSPEEIESVIQYQASTHFSTPASELSIGHIAAPPFENEVRCLLLALPQHTERQWRTFCESAGLNLMAIVPRSVAVTDCLRGFASVPFEASTGRIVVVRDELLDGSVAEICFLQAERLIQNISVMLPEDSANWPHVISGSLRRILSGTVTSEPVDISNVVLVGDFPAEIDSQLSAQTDLPVRRKNLNALVRLADPLVSPTQALTVGTVASCLSNQMSVNFLEEHHKQTAVSRKARQAKYVMLAAVGIAIGLFVQNRFARSRHDLEMSELVSQRRSVEQQIVAGQAEAELVEQIDRWQDVRFSKRLTKFLDVLSSADQSQLTSLNLALRRGTDELTIQASGLTTRQETIVALNDRLLAQADYTLLPHGLQPVHSNGPMKYRYDLDIAIKNQTGVDQVQSKFAVRPSTAKPHSVTLDQLQSRLQQAKTELAEVERVRQRLNKTASRTLAGTPSQATQQYHKVLLCLAQQYEMADLVFAPHRPQTVNDRLSTIPFSLQASTTLLQLQKFIAHFEQLDLLHRLTLVMIEPSVIAGDQTLKCRMQFETACVEVANIEEYLNPTALFVAPFSEEHLALSDHDPFFGSMPVSTQTVVEATERPEPAAILELIGVIEDGGNSEAWFLDKTTGQNHIAKLNGHFDHDALAGRLVAVDQDSATLLIANSQVQLVIGEKTRKTDRIAIRP